jgi:prefoldin subunit 5
VVIGGATAWLTRIATQTNANASTLEKISLKQDMYSDHLAAIHSDIAVIRQEIKEIKERQEEIRKWKR